SGSKNGEPQHGRGLGPRVRGERIQEWRAAARPGAGAPRARRADPRMASRSTAGGWGPACEASGSKNGEPQHGRGLRPPPLSGDRKGQVIMADDKLNAPGGEPNSDVVTVPGEVAVLPLRDTVLFPQSILPLAAGRPSSLHLIDDAVRSGHLIGVFSQRD